MCYIAYCTKFIKIQWFSYNYLNCAWISLDKLNPLYQIKEQNARYKEEVSGENLICTMHDINTTDEIGWCLRIENYETLWT